MGKYDNYSKEELIDELETLKKKKYGLVWDKKNSQEMLDVFVNWENVPENFAPKQFPVLKEVKNKEIENDKAKPVNLLIEGDNYHSLAVLNFTHQNEVDVIYIDPPYNTGNKDFIYNDKFVDRDDPFRHSKWLSFMEKRLKLAHRLLKNSGGIFISIDDNEQAQLKLLCDEIFGDKNFVGVLTWIRKRKPSHLDIHVRKNTEFVLCYAKSIKSFLALKSSFAEDNKPYPFYNSGNSRNALSFPGSYVKVESLPDGIYKKGKYFDKKTVVELFNDVIIKNGIVVTPFKLFGEWRYSQKTLEELIDKKEEIVLKGKKMKPYYIRKLMGSIEELKNVMTILGSTGKLRKGLENIEPELLVGTNEDAEEELNQFGLEVKFNNPKPVSLIEFLIKIATVYNKSATILDFMAGSGTTGQAVLKLNNEDEGNRNFLLCTNDEELDNEGESKIHKICSDVCYPRLRKAISGYKNLNGEQITGLGGNLKYFKTDFVGSDSTDKNKRDLVNKSTEMICIKEDIFDLVTDGGLDYRIYQKGKKFLGVIFELDAIADFKKEAEKYKGNFVVYCFSYTETTPEKEFKGLKNKYVLKPIPAVILRIYLEIFKK